MELMDNVIGEPMDAVTRALHEATPAHRLWLLDTAADVLHRLRPRPCGSETRCGPGCRPCTRAYSLGILWLARAPSGYQVYVPALPVDPAPVPRALPAHEQVAERLRARRLARGEVG
jgi:hypothetical protein